MEQERYEIIKLLGKGRTGGVYEAEDTVLGRRVAMRRFFDIEGDSDSSTWQDSFMEITQKLCALQHPGLATVYDAGVDEDGAYMISQLLNGQAISERLKEGPIKEWDVFQMVEGILDALSAAHEAGFVHGAFNPSSIIRVPRASGGYRNIIVDLGLSRLAPLIQGEQSSFALMAEPTMMAPEQFDGNPATEVSDLYALGQFAYICLIGGHPFAGKSMEDAAESHKSEMLKPLHEYDAGVSKEFSDWVAQLIEKDPADRPGTADKALSSLPKLKRPTDRKARRNAFSGIATPGALANGPATALTEGNKGGTATNRLRPVAPAISAQATQALNTGAHMSLNPGNPPATTQVLISPTAPVQQSIPPSFQQRQQPSKSSNIVLFSIIGGLVLVLIIVIAANVMGGSGAETKPEQDVTQKPEDDGVDLTVPRIDNPSNPNENEGGGTTDPIVTSVSQYGTVMGSPKLITKLRSELENAHLVRVSEDLKGFMIASGRGLGAQHKRKKPYFTTVHMIGGCRPVPLKTFAFKYQLQDSDVMHYVNIHTNSSAQGKLAEWGGYRIDGKVADSHSGPLQFKLHFSTWNCKIKVEVRRKGEKKSQAKAAYISKASGGYELEFSVEGLKKGEPFEIYLLSKGPIDEGVSALIFHSIVIK